MKLAITETTKIGPSRPWLSIIRFLLILLCINKLNAPAIKPAINAIKKTAPIFYMTSARPPTIIPPVTVPIMIP